jgi:hypothetical protein
MRRAAAVHSGELYRPRARDVMKRNTSRWIAGALAAFLLGSVSSCYYGPRPYYGHYPYHHHHHRVVYAAPVAAPPGTVIITP